LDQAAEDLLAPAAGGQRAGAIADEVEGLAQALLAVAELVREVDVARTHQPRRDVAGGARGDRRLLEAAGGAQLIRDRGPAGLALPLGVGRARLAPRAHQRRGQRRLVPRRRRQDPLAVVLDVAEVAAERALPREPLRVLGVARRQLLGAAQPFGLAGARAVEV